MLQRLYASLTSGPGLNARPHFSRQRIDLLELRHLASLDPAKVLAGLLGGSRAADIAAKVPVFEKPDRPESEWTETQRSAKAASDRQTKVLGKLREITEDATDYFNDHGEHALFLGFPILSLPPTADRQGFGSQRILAPLAMVPVNLAVRRGASPGLRLEVAGDGADLVQPNPALLAWIEQQTGVSTEALYADASGEEPWREIEELIALVAKAASVEPAPAFGSETILQPVPRTEELPGVPTILSCAVLGLFPLGNPGLLRDTKWMQENEAGLGTPVKSFLAPAVLQSPKPEDESSARPDVSPLSAGARDFASEQLVAIADPCQAEAVAHARRSAALVIHGPPGTGKSQTIANIIGDHLARGERVLFVCDKRTALDVVKYRLDSMGLGPLCGVIHDPSRDRRDFYLGLRERLEGLAEAPIIADPTKDLARVNQQLASLHAELRRCFDALHGEAEGTGSFHRLCGEWLALTESGAAVLPENDALTIELVSTHRADCEEVLRRALSAGWPANPFRGRLGLSLTTWLATTPAEVKGQLSAIVASAGKVDSLTKPDSLPLAATGAAAAQAELFRRLADAVERIVKAEQREIPAALATETHSARWRTECDLLADDAARLGKPLERELLLQIRDRLPSLPEVFRHLAALEQYRPLVTSWKRFFAFAKKKAAGLAVAPLGVPLDAASLERSVGFYEGLRARLRWMDLREQIVKSRGDALPDDAQLGRTVESIKASLEALSLIGGVANSELEKRIRSSLGDIASLGDGLIQALRQSAVRADAIAELEKQLSDSGLLTQTANAELSARWRSNEPVVPLCRPFLESVDTLDEMVRLNDRLTILPKPLQESLDAAAMRGLSWDQGGPALRLCAIAREIRLRLKSDETLTRIDSRRIEAALAEMDRLGREKIELVRRRVLHRWQETWRTRLLASTGGRLNSSGAALRQRLFVRGEKAMKLRQMIAAGAGQEGGDPLFDLCPVWMAGPSTVAQVFPREALFDVVVFDEASQCRLEEALPVLLRAKRVVIAGDPKQLPPTRFFEQALAESDGTSAETAEEVFNQQQSEAEDLLSAALNLDVQEAFLDVHYRSRNAGLIGYSNDAFYGGRLLPIPGRPTIKDVEVPVRLVRVDGVYLDRGNELEARRAAELVAELLSRPEPPSIGVACFNLNQRDLVLDALDEMASADAAFAAKLETARKRQGRDSFEGLFVKNLENVQGDERDHMIISTTFGPDTQGRFRRNFGALSRSGGERRLNVLVTRARAMVHVLTSIPRAEYLATETAERLTGRHHLYGYLRYAEGLQSAGDATANLEQGNTGNKVSGACVTSTPSPMVDAVAQGLVRRHGVGSIRYWGNDGFCVDLAVQPAAADYISVGVQSDFTRYRKTPDPIAWEQFRTSVLANQGWTLQRLWSPAVFRDVDSSLRSVAGSRV